MSHSDDDGLILPPKIAPTHVVILPIIRKDSDQSKIMEYCHQLAKKLNDVFYDQQKVKVAIDDRDMSGGEKNWQYIKQGVPIRLEVGQKEVEQQTVFMGRRDRSPRDKEAVGCDAFVQSCSDYLAEIQQQLYQRAVDFQQQHTHQINDFDAFRALFTPDNPKQPEIHGGFAECLCIDDDLVYEMIKPFKVSARCIPLEQEEASGRCIFTGKPATQRVIFAKAY